MLTLNGSAKPSMVALAPEVTSQVDCGVPCCWFSHATGLAHEEESCAAAEDADAAGARAVRAQAATRAMTAIRPRNRLGLRIAMRAIALPDFARAAALLTIPLSLPAPGRQMRRCRSALKSTPSALVEGVQPDAFPIRRAGAQSG